MQEPKNYPPNIDQTHGRILVAELHAMYLGREFFMEDPETGDAITGALTKFNQQLTEDGIERVKSSSRLTAKDISVTIWLAGRKFKLAGDEILVFVDTDGTSGLI